MPRKKQVEETKKLDETLPPVLEDKIDKIVDAIVDSPEVDKALDAIVDETVENDTRIDELQPPLETVTTTANSADVPVTETPAVIESTITPPAEFEPPQPTVEVPLVIEPVKEVISETVTVDKRALYRLVQALNRNQTHMYIGTAATRFLGELFYLGTLVERTAKWEEVKKWNEENSK
jgi:hypothetical protein